MSIDDCEWPWFVFRFVSFHLHFFAREWMKCWWISYLKPFVHVSSYLTINNLVCCPEGMVVLMERFVRHVFHSFLIHVGYTLQTVAQIQPNDNMEHAEKAWRLVLSEAIPLRPHSGVCSLTLMMCAVEEEPLRSRVERQNGLMLRLWFKWEQQKAKIHVPFQCHQQLLIINDCRAALHDHLASTGSWPSNWFLLKNSPCEQLADRTGDKHMGAIFSRGLIRFL